METEIYLSQLQFNDIWVHVQNERRIITPLTCKRGVGAGANIWKKLFSKREVYGHAL